MLPHKFVKSYSAEQIKEVLAQLIKIYGSFSYDIKKHTLSFPSHDSISIRLPLNVTYENNAFLSSNFLLIVIHSGEASIAYSEEDQIIQHKMIKAYMVRQKQGKSQIKHLKTKGKSKAGSRVRLAGTDHFFEEINEKLSEWLDYHEIEKIAVSCNKTLQPFFFNRTDAALKKDDERIFKIPKHIQEANFENLLSVHQYLISAEISFQDDIKSKVQTILQSIDNQL